MLVKLNNRLLDSLMDEPFFRNTFKDNIHTCNCMNFANVLEKDTSYEIQIVAPGLSKEFFSIEVKNNTAVIKCTVPEQKEELGKYTLKEFSPTSFTKSYKLPENVDSEKIKGKYENGILFIEVPKSTEKMVKAKEIKIS